jgi:hypothetical protein
LCTSGTNSYCNQLWSACASVDISNSPFEPVLQNGSTKATAPLSSFYNSSADFCAGETADSDSFCFNGTALQLPPLVAHTPPAGMCLERLDNATAGFGYYLNLVPHPDSSDRVFVNTQDGHVFLVNVSLPGSGQPFGIGYSSPFLDISNRTISSGELGFPFPLQLPHEDGWDSPTPLSHLTQTLLAHNSPRASPRIQFLSRRPLPAQTNPHPQRRFFRNDTSAQHKHPRSLLGNLLTPSA